MIKTTTTTINPTTSVTELLLTFLNENNKSWYNSKSIIEFGKKDQKFSAFKAVTSKDIRSHLDALVTAKRLRSHKSEKGNWLLYKI